MKKQFLSIIAAGLMLGGVSQINAMEQPVEPSLTDAVASQNLPITKVSPQHTCPVLLPALKESTVLLPAELSGNRDELITNLEQTNEHVRWQLGTMTPIATIFGVHDYIHGWGVYEEATVLNSSKTTLIKFAPLAKRAAAESDRDYARRLAKQRNDVFDRADDYIEAEKNQVLNECNE